MNTSVPFADPLNVNRRVWCVKTFWAGPLPDWLVFSRQSIYTDRYDHKFQWL